MRVRYLLISIALLVVILLPTLPPFSFPSGSIITVPEGAGLYTLAEKLEEDKVIRSPFWFRTIAILLGGERRMRAGEYYMPQPQNVFTVAWRVFSGDHDIKTVRLTIPEGFTADEIAELFDDRFPFFDHQSFLAVAKEGYLFPDTYFIPVTATASSTLLLFENNFERNVSDLFEEIQNSGHSLSDIVKMASILESELQSEEDKRIASGILWRRLKIGMPLQVDSEPDTYKYTGFPPNPIANPGLESIEAALHPTTTDYLYFLTGDDGKTYYSKTFEEHVAAKLEYIKR